MHRLSRDTSRSPWGLYSSALLAIAGVGIASLFVGYANLENNAISTAIVQLRALRLAAAGLTGAALAVGGVLVQGLFRNPLASPSIIGTSAGASLGGRCGLLLAHVLIVSPQTTLISPELFLPLGAIAGALLSLVILVLVARTSDDLVVILLAGFLLSSLFISIGGLAISLAQEHWELARAMLWFALGDLSGSGPIHILLSATPIAIAIIAAWGWGRSLDILLSGDIEARALGIDVRQIKYWVIIWTAILTGSAVAMGGTIGFVGLVVPNGLRALIGPTHRQLVPASALGGALFVMICDLICRALPSTTEIPLGVITGLIGAPTFLYLLLRQRGFSAEGRTHA